MTVLTRADLEVFDVISSIHWSRIDALQTTSVPYKLNKQFSKKRKEKVMLAKSWRVGEERDRDLFGFSASRFLSTSRCRSIFAIVVSVLP
jgi:hypothetical protein